MFLHESSYLRLCWCDLHKVPDNVFVNWMDFFFFSHILERRLDIKFDIDTSSALTICLQWNEISDFYTLFDFQQMWASKDCYSHTQVLVLLDTGNIICDPALFFHFIVSFKFGRYIATKRFSKINFDQLIILLILDTLTESLIGCDDSRIDENNNNEMTLMMLELLKSFFWL